MKTSLYISAGGNTTALVHGGDYDQSQYAEINHRLQRNNSDIEQVGFLEKDDEISRLQMAGGEFCGNASMAFACLLKDLYPDQSEFKYFVSGYSELIHVRVDKTGNKYHCSAQFKNFQYTIKKSTYNGHAVEIVDLGGIIHIVVNADDMPFDAGNYEKEMKQIKDALGVDHDAVGVLWISSDNDQIKMEPVVWVRAIDTCYYETSCGSGSIAVALARGHETDIIQPTGESISVDMNDTTLIISACIQKIKQ